MNPATPQLHTTEHTFTQLLSATRRGTRLARLLTAEKLRAWDVDMDTAECAEQIVAELAANAAFHGNVRGRGFRISLTLDDASATLRIEVSDARGDRLPEATRSPADESGRGLLIVESLADGWGVEGYAPGGKTVWAELAKARLGSSAATGSSARAHGRHGPHESWRV
ncbi:MULTISPECIES: ATP-binding protein [unclassified Streptomyces]|uniref:ATP-binding protein n=1 Tax=unclassified Streptomyces TaxID=2593676 RepID=UPI00278BFD60|nr:MULTISPECIES: ATP-binding protein [unclassified Streptomyces]